MLPELVSIKERRKALGLTQKELADMCDVSQSLITKVERDTTVPNYETAKRIFEELDRLETEEEQHAEDTMNGDVIVLETDDSVEQAASLAKENNISQFPVTDGEKLVGSILTKDMLDAPKDAEVGKFTEPSMPTVGRDAPISSVKELLKHNRAVLVVEEGSIVGIITAADLL